MPFERHVFFAFCLLWKYTKIENIFRRFFQLFLFVGEFHNFFCIFKNAMV
jgi:hypothetical protein